MDLVHQGGLCDTQLGVLGMFLGFVNYRTQQVSDSGADSHAWDNRQPAGPLFCWVGGDRQRCGPTAEAVAFCPRRGPHRGRAVRFGESAAPESSI